MFLRSFLGQLARAVFRPAKPGVDVRPLRALVGLPVLFDVVSLVMQTVDYRRTRRIAHSVAPGGSHHRAAHDYNAGVTLEKVFTSTRRMDVYYKLLTLPNRRVDKDRLLIVGPRNRHELLSAWVHGFHWQNIEAVDLYSTHPKIHVMNMEEMTWPDESFDAVSMSNTLSYASDTSRAIAEVARVLRPDGRFAFSATFDPESRWKEDSVPAATIAEFLRASGFLIEAHFAEIKMNSQGRRQTSHAFLARKHQGGESWIDPSRS